MKKLTAGVTARLKHHALSTAHQIRHEAHHVLRGHAHQAVEHLAKEVRDARLVHPELVHKATHAVHKFINGKGFLSSLKNFGNQVKGGFDKVAPALKVGYDIAKPFLKPILNKAIDYGATAIGSTPLGAFASPLTHLATDYAHSAVNGSGFLGAGVRPKKGSAEAKAKMARVRAGKKGSGLIDDVGDFFGGSMMPGGY